MPEKYCCVTALPLGDSVISGFMLVLLTDQMHPHWMHPDFTVRWTSSKSFHWYNFMKKQHQLLAWCGQNIVKNSVNGWLANWTWAGSKPCSKPPIHLRLQQELMSWVTCCASTQPRPTRRPSPLTCLMHHPDPCQSPHNLTGVMCRCAVHALYTNPQNCPVKFSVLGGHSKISLCGKWWDCLNTTMGPWNRSEESGHFL